MWRDADCVDGILSPNCLPLLVAGGGGGAYSSDAQYRGDDGRADHSGGSSIGFGGEGGQSGNGGVSATGNLYGSTVERGRVGSRGGNMGSAGVGVHLTSSHLL